MYVASIDEAYVDLSEKIHNLFLEFSKTSSHEISQENEEIDESFQENEENSQILQENDTENQIIDENPSKTEQNLQKKHEKESILQEFVSELRNLITTSTKCPCSCGISHNMLLARIATKKAKPAGQFHLKLDDSFNDQVNDKLILSFLAPLNIGLTIFFSHTFPKSKLNP